MDIPLELPLLFYADDSRIRVVTPSGLPLSLEAKSSFEDIFTHYRKQVTAQAKTKKRFLLAERMPSLAEARAALLASRGFEVPVFVCLAADQPDADERFLPALITLQAMGAKAVGLCGKPNETMRNILREALPHAAVPLVAVADAQPDESLGDYQTAVCSLLDAGVRIIGCGKGTTLQHMGVLRESIKKYGPPEISEEPDCCAAATEWETFFLGDNMEFSKMLRCSASLSDELIDLDDEQVSAALVDVESVDDAVLLGQNSSMTKLPIAVHADSSTVLEAALRYFQGRLIIDSDSLVEPEVLEPLAAKYGAILY